MMALAFVSLSLFAELPTSPISPLSSSCCTLASGVIPPPSSLLVTHRFHAPSYLIFQFSNSSLARCVHRHRSCCSLRSSSPSHHSHLCSPARVLQEGALSSPSDESETVSSNPYPITSYNDAGRSKPSEKYFESSDDASEPSQGTISSREFPWDSDKPSNLPFDLQYSFSPESVGKESSAPTARFRPSSRQEEVPGVNSKNSRQFPTFIGKSRLRAPWNESHSQRLAVRESPLKIPLAGGRQYILQKDQEQLEFREEEKAFVDEKGEKSAMTRLVDKLRTVADVKDSRSSMRTPGSYQNARASLSSRFSDDSSSSLGCNDVANLRFPWDKVKDKEEDKGEDEGEDKAKRYREPYQAEIVLPESELKRLLNLSLRAIFRLKIGKDGVTDSVVGSIHQQWRQAEVVRIKCEGPPAFNMKKTHEELEGKTGGLVIWRSGSAITVYRGQNYVFPSLSSCTRQEWNKEAEKTLGSKFLDTNNEDGDVPMKLVKNNQENGENSKEDYEKEIESLLDGLGPRFDCWTGPKPVPIDGDLLPAFDPNFKPPLRRLPYRVRANLSNTELTALRRLARPLPPHFVLGRNEKLEGLGGAILKLWEKSEVVKISVKRGVQNTRNERMAEELKRLTGGILLARDKFFITLYRGKDFLPPAVSLALKEREALTIALQEDEERKRMIGAKLSDDICGPSSTAGTLSEAIEVRSRWENWRSNEEQKKERETAVKSNQLYEVQSMERKLKIATLKKQRAELELAKVQKDLAPLDAPADREAITDEEKFMFRKLGLKMKAFLLLGRRGIFDGVVENMHLHWKHRELVKIILKEKDMAIAMDTARMLEYESGGILIAVVTVSKGQAIIVYRGKNYSRPPQLRPKNLLTKRKALKQSIELQRRKSLERHISHLEKEIRRIKYKNVSTSGSPYEGHEKDVNDPGGIGNEADVSEENMDFDSDDADDDDADDDEHMDEDDAVDVDGRNQFEKVDYSHTYPVHYARSKESRQQDSKDTGFVQTCS